MNSMNRILPDGLKTLSKSGRFIPGPKKGPFTYAAETQVKYLTYALVIGLGVLTLESGFESLKGIFSNK